MNDIRKWYEKAGKDSDIVCSTRIRLARNLKSYPFGNKCSEEDKKAICTKTRDAIFNSGAVIADQFDYIELNGLNPEIAVSLVEKHLASPEFISKPNGRALLLSKDESVSIMINEEDHIRIQVLKEGLSLKEAFETADRIDNLLNEGLEFAFDDELGFLTCCPTNLGTGMRASVMLHLPLMSQHGQIPAIASNLAKLGMTIRGTYGEGTKVSGDLYQLSNQITLGLSENEAIENLFSVANQLINEERAFRNSINTSVDFLDKISRSLALLKSAKLMTNKEAVELLSDLRLGISVGVLTGMDLEEISGITANITPAVLSLNTGRDGGEKLSPRDRSIERANILREKLKYVKD